MVRKSAITSMFAGSPVRPLQQHMDKVQTCVNELIPFSRAIIDGDYRKAIKSQICCKFTYRQFGHRHLMLRTFASAA